MGFSFFGAELSTPCEGCSAPCCSRLVLPYPAPVKYMEFDYLTYVLGFPNMSVLLNKDGRWSLVINATCHKLDEKTHRCTVHGTAEQPRTCVYFNPHDCWYKRNFNESESPDIIELDRAHFRQLLQSLSFDDKGLLTGWPGWNAVREQFAQQ
jgi:hypothetical protein